MDESSLPSPFMDKFAIGRSTQSLPTTSEGESSKPARVIQRPSPFTQASSKSLSAVQRATRTGRNASSPTSAISVPTISEWESVGPASNDSLPMPSEGESSTSASAVTSPSPSTPGFLNPWTATSPLAPPIPGFTPPPAYSSGILQPASTALPIKEELHSESGSTEPEKLEKDKKDKSDENDVQDLYLPTLEGWSLAITSFSLCLCLLLATIDTTIIATSLITISSDLGHFDKSSWVVVAYLLTYSGFLVVYARLSDIFGRKPILLIAVTKFLVWSIGCGCAQTINQLIIFRMLQGCGGAGIYALAYASMLDIVPPRLVSAASGAISMSTACASILGPIIGGVITSNTTWRWVFWINIPCGVGVTIAVIFMFPSITRHQTMKSSLKKIDFPGIFLSLGGSVLLLVPLEEGGVDFAWDSAPVALMFVFSALCLIGFGAWEHILTLRELKWKMLPLFPTRLVKHRVIGATLCTVFFSGFPFVVTIITLPQRFQIVNGNTPARAGLHMLPLIITTAASAILAGALTTHFNIAWHLLVFSNGLAVIGCGLMSTLSAGLELLPINYLYQIILGCGFGLTLASSMVVALGEITKKDNAVTMGATTQLRQLGGVIGLAATQAIRAHSYGAKLANTLTPPEVAAVLMSPSNIATLSLADAAFTQRAYGESCNLQMKTVLGFAVAAFVASLFAYKKLPLRVQELEVEEPTLEERKSQPGEDSDNRTLDGGELTDPSQKSTELIDKDAHPTADEESNASTFGAVSPGTCVPARSDDSSIAKP